MSWSSCKVFCVYPQDNSTRFLNRIVSYLKRNLGDDFHCFKVKLHEGSHTECIKKIDELENKVIIFLGHGKSNLLYGACGSEAESAFINHEAVEENPEYFNKQDFINMNNCSIFKNNIVFSFSCNSNQIKNSIGNTSIMNGAISFIGFGDIPSDFETEKELTQREISIFKGIIVKIIKKSFLFSWKQNFSIEQLVDTIKVMTNKEVFKLTVNNKGIKYRYRIAKHLFYFKNEIEVFGQKYIKLQQS